MKIRLLSVGKDKGPTAELAQDYAERIRRVADLEILEVTHRQDAIASLGWCGGESSEHST